MDVVSGVVLAPILDGDHVAFQGCRNVMVRLNQTLPAIDTITHTGTQTGFAHLDADFSSLKRDSGSYRFGIAPAVEIRMAAVDHLMAQFGKLEHELGRTRADLLFKFRVVTGTEGVKG